MSSRAAHVRLRRPGDPVDDVRRAPRRSSPTSGTRRTSPGSSATTRSALAAGVSGSPPTEAQLAAMERFVREAMDAGALGHVDRARVQPRAARRPTDELVRLNAVAGELRRHLHEPRPQPRLAAPGRDRGVPRGRPRRRDRSGRDLAPERPPQHGRARPRLGAGGRADGGGARGGDRRARRHDAVPRRPRPARRDPAAVGRGRRQGGGARVPARPRHPRAAARRVRPLLALHPQGRVGARAPAGERAASRLGRAHVRPDRRRCARPIRGTATSTCSPTPGTPTRASSSSAGSSPTSTWRR